MILFYCLLMALAICYWATLFDPIHRRLHSSAFIVLLVATGWERWQAEHDDAHTNQMMIAEPTQSENVFAHLTTAYTRGKDQWHARQNLLQETQLTRR